MPRWYAYDESGHLLGTYFRFMSGYYETVYLGDLPIAVMDQVNGVKYADTDHLGSVRAVSDAAQRTIYTWNPGTFGTASPSTDPDGDHNSFNYYGRFPGQYYSSESTLHYNYFRDYDPQTGRYVEPDPVGILPHASDSPPPVTREDRELALPQAVASLHYGLDHPYSYAKSSPTRFTDPLGLLPGPADESTPAVQAPPRTINQ